MPVPYKKLIFRLVAWSLTAFALYSVLHGTDWKLLSDHLKGANWWYLGGAVALTCWSYLLRAHRWRYLFDRSSLNFENACKVLLLGFYMNNVLPARTGELVRAHLGAKVTGEKRTFVLATIASERLIDGLVLSLFFLMFSFGRADSVIGTKLLYVTVIFGVATIGVMTVLTCRARLSKLASNLLKREHHPYSQYALDRVGIFLDGLMPLTNWQRLPRIAFWSLCIWLIELLVYVAIMLGFGIETNLCHSILFLVAVNFASLIPLTPGAFGVIETITVVVLASIGIPRELGLPMVLAQHLIQFFVVGIPGAMIMFTWKKKIGNLDEPDTVNCDSSLQ